jgi:hypothetical protein
VNAAAACTDTKTTSTRNGANEKSEAYLENFLMASSRDKNEEFSMQLDFLVAFEYAQKELFC